MSARSLGYPIRRRCRVDTTPATPILPVESPRRRREVMTTLTTAGPSISLRERDRRHAAIKAAFRERGVDAAILTGTNLFYVTNGLPGEQIGVFPTADEPQA